MPDGFGIVPDELRYAAGKIGDVIGKVAGAVWQGPSGDYGHPGVQAGWTGFIDEMRRHVETLRDKADGHGQGLISTATSYSDTESDVGAIIGEVGSMLQPAGTEVPTGFLHSSIALRLNPDGDA